MGVVAGTLAAAAFVDGAAAAIGAGGAFMIVGAVGAGASGVAANNASTLGAACNEYADALQQYCVAKQGWLDKASRAGKDKTKFLQANEDLATAIGNYKVGVAGLKEQFKQKLTGQIIVMSLFMLLLIVFLMAKYFDVWHKLAETIKSIF